MTEVRLNDDDVAGRENSPEEHDTSLQDEDEDDTLDTINHTTSIYIPAMSYSKFSLYEDEKYNNNGELKEQNLQNDIDRVWDLGVEQYINTTSTSSSFHERDDVMKKCAKIAVLLEMQREFYPDRFSLKIVETIVKDAIHSKDERTKRKYWIKVREKSSKNYRNGTINVERFCTSIPRELKQRAREELESR